VARRGDSETSDNGLVLCPRPAAARGPVPSQNHPCPEGAAPPCPRRGEGACQAARVWGTERSFWDTGDPRAAEVPVDALQS